MMSKNKILKGIDQHLENTSYCISDIQLDDRIPIEFKDGEISRLMNLYKSLNEIKKQLNELLI